MSGIGIPKYILLQYGSQGMSWLLLAMGLMWCSFAWWKTQKNRASLAILITSGATLIGILVLVGFGIVATFTLRGSGPGGSTNVKLIEGLLMGIMGLIVMSWLTCSVFFFSFGYRWVKGTQPSVDLLNGEHDGQQL